MSERGGPAIKHLNTQHTTQYRGAVAQCIAADLERTGEAQAWKGRIFTTFVKTRVV